MWSCWGPSQGLELELDWYMWRHKERRYGAAGKTHQRQAQNMQLAVNFYFMLSVCLVFGIWVATRVLDLLQSDLNQM